MPGIITINGSFSGSVADLAPESIKNFNTGINPFHNGSNNKGYGYATHILPNFALKDLNVLSAKN